MIFDPSDMNDPVVEETRAVADDVARRRMSATQLVALAVAIVMGLWLVYYLAVQLPRS